MAGKTTIYIGGGVSTGLLNGMLNLRQQLLSLSNAAKEAKKADVSSDLSSMANAIRDAVQTVQESADSTGDSLREMFQEIAQAANEYVNSMRTAAGVGEEVTKDLSDFDKKASDSSESLAMMSKQLSMMDDDSIKELRNALGQLAKEIDSTDGEADELSKSIKVLQDLWQLWTDGIDDPKGLKSAEKALQRMADAIYGTQRALREADVDMPDWADKLDAEKLRDAFQKGLIEPTQRGFKIYDEKASEFINLTKEQIDVVNKYTNAMSDLDKELRDTSNWDNQTEAQRKYKQALHQLTETRGQDSKEIKHWLSTLRKSEEALSRYKSRYDETDKEMRSTIDTVDRLSLVQGSLNDDIKVTRNGIQVLTRRGLEPFKDMTLETADSIGVLSKKLKKELEEATGFEFDAIKTESIEKIRNMAPAIKEVAEETNLYRKRLAELRGEEDKGIEGAKEMRQAWEKLASEYEDNNKAVEQVWKNLNKIENTIHSQVSALDEQDAAYESLIRNMDRVTAYQKIFGKSDDLKIMNKRFQALNESGLQPFKRLTEESADKLGILHTRYKRNIQDTREQADAYDEWTQAIKKVSGQNQAHAEALEQMGRLYGKDTDSIHRYNSAVLQAYKNINKYIDTKKTQAAVIRQEIEKREQAGKSADKYRKKIEQLEKEISEAHKKQSLLNETSQVWKERAGLAQRGSSDFAQANKRLREETSMLGMALGHVGRRMKQFAAFMAAALIVRQLTIAIREFIQTVSNFDQVLYNLQAIIEVTTDQAQVLGDAIKDVARDTKFSAAEVGDGVRLLGQAGFDMVQAMQSLPGVARLATGTMEKLDSVVELVTTTINAFQMETTRASEVADIFANAINASKLNIDKLNTAFNYVGAAGKQAGLTINELTGSLMVLADNGIRASTMGTGLRRMLLKMISPSTELKEEMTAYGNTLDDINPKVVGLQGALGNLAPYLWDFEKDTVDMGKAVDYFGTRAAQVAAVLIRETAEGGAITRAIEKTRELGSAARMAALQQEGLELKIKNLVDRTKNAAIALGDAGLTGIIKGVVDVLRGLASAAESILSTQAASWIVPVVALSTAMFTLNSAFVGLAHVITRYGLIKKLFAIKTLLLGWPGYVAIAVGALGTLIYKIETYHKRSADAAGKAAEEMTKSADSIQSYGEVLASASREGSKAFSDAVYYIEQDASEIADKLANELGYKSLSELAEGFENGSERAKSALAELRGDSNKSLTEMAARFGDLGKDAEEILEGTSVATRLAAEEFNKAGKKMVDSIIHTRNELNKQRDRRTPGFKYSAFGFTWGDDEEYEKAEAQLEDRIERLTHIALEEAHLRGKESVEEFGAFIREQYADDFGDSTDLMDKFVERAVKTFEYMSSEAGVSIKELKKVVAVNAKEISALLEKLSPEQKFEFAGAMGNIRKEVENYRKWLEENTDYTKSRIEKLVSDFKTDLQKEELHGIMGMESTDFEENLAKLEMSYKEKKAKVEEDSQEMIDIRREELKEKLKMYEKELSVAEETDVGRLRSIKSTLLELRKELKDLDDDERDLFAESIEEMVEDTEFMYKRRKSLAEENSLEMHRLNIEEAKDKVKTYQQALDQVEDKDSELAKTFEGKLIDSKEQLKDLQKAQRDFVYENLSQKIDNVYDRRLQKVKANSVAELEIERDRIQELLKLDKERYESAETDHEKQSLESQLISRENELAQNQIDLMDKRAEKIETASERAANAMERELAALDLNIEKQKFYGEMSESDGILAMSRKELEVAEQKLQKQREDLEEFKKIYGEKAEDMNTFKDAKAKEAELEQDVNQRTLDDLRAQIEAADVLYSKKRALAESRRELALAGIEEERERTLLMKDESDNVVARLEKETRASYESYEKRLGALKEYIKSVKQAYDDKLQAFVDAEATENEEYKQLLIERRLFMLEHQRELKELEDKATRAQIREHGTLWEKTKLGLQNFSDDLEDSSNNWVDNVTDAAEQSRSAWNDAFSDFIMGSESASNAFKSFASSMLESMADVLAQSVTKKFMGLFVNMLGGSLGDFGSSGTPEAPASGQESVSPFAMAGPMHTGGVVGEESGGALRLVSASLFDGAKKLHDGIKGLSNTEYPAILKKGEVVFTEGQINALGKSMDSSQQPPQVSVNVINKTSEKVDAEEKEPKFDGEKWVLDVVLNAANRNKNNFGKNLKGTLKKA